MIAPPRLWTIPLATTPPAAGIASLTSGERDRAERFRFERDRRRYLAAHVALRGVLAHVTGMPHGHLTIAVDALGKPYLREDPSCRFSLSYAGDTALIGVGRDHPIGVDVEAVRAIDDVDALAAAHFTPAEHRRIAGIADATRRSATFLSGWTRKEACLKALGTGLRVPPGAIAAGLWDEEVTVAIGSARLRVAGARPAPGLIAAWSVVEAAPQ